MAERVTVTVKIPKGIQVIQQVFCEPSKLDKPWVTVLECLRWYATEPTEPRMWDEGVDFCLMFLGIVEGEMGWPSCSFRLTRDGRQILAWLEDGA